MRWPEHLAGGYDPVTRKATGRGARLLAAALYAGCTVELVRAWYGEQARTLEQRLKQRHHPDSDSLRAGAKTSLKPLCPVCNPGRALRRYPDLPDPPPPPHPGRFLHDQEVWDADREWDLAFPHLAYDTPAQTQPPAIPPNPRSVPTQTNPADQEHTMGHSTPINPDQAFLEPSRAAQQDHDRQEAFAQLNPDFGVLPDSRHPDQHRFAQQRERALALGERVAAAEQFARERSEPSDTFSFPRLQAPPHTPAERATDQRDGMRQRLLEGFQRRQAAREQRPSTRPSRSTRARTNPADQERER